MDFIPHQFQQKVLNSKARTILASSGIQGGKTIIGAVWLLKEMWIRGLDKNYLMVAPTYKILNQSTLAKFWEILEDNNKIGVYRKADSEYRLHDGGRLFIRSADNPEHLEGMTVSGAAWADEAGQMPRTVWTNILGRTAIARAPILLTTTPYTLNWVYTDVIKPAQEGNKDYEVFAWRSVDNPYFTKEEYETRRKTMNEGDFARRYMGEWRQLSGLVYADFNPNRDVVELPVVNTDEFYCGVDFGFTNPTAIVWATKNKDKDYYIFQEYYQRTRTAIESAVAYQKMSVGLGKIRINYCDCTALEQMHEWIRSGIKSVVGIKIDKQASIRRVTEFLRAGKLKIHPRCKNLIGELERYRNAVSRIDGELEPKEEPVKNGDHAADALRYMIYNSSVNDGMLAGKEEIAKPVPTEKETIATLIDMAKKEFSVVFDKTKKQIQRVVYSGNNLYLDHF